MMGWGPYPIRLVAVARLAINLSTVRGVGDEPYDFAHGSPLFFTRRQKLACADSWLPGLVVANGERLAKTCRPA